VYKEQVSFPQDVIKYYTPHLNFWVCFIFVQLYLLKTKISLNYIVRFSSYRAVNTIVGYKKTSRLMLCSEIIAVCSEIHIKHVNTLCRQNVELLNVKPGGT
jgi:hypothetical protein